MDYHCSFARGCWDENDFLKVRSPRWMETSRWIQDDDGIRNFMPDDIRPEDMQMGRDRTGETYISMLLKRPFSGNALFRAKCAFISRMAPLLVFSKTLGPVHQDHLEVVLYDRGVNLWHHYWTDGKPSWKLLGFIDLELETSVPHELTAQFIFNSKGVFLTMSCDGHDFGCRIDGDWPETYYAGFTACEGKNKFYSFSAEEKPALNAPMKERFSD